MSDALLKKSPESPDNVVTLSRFRGDIARALARRGKKIVESHNVAEQVVALQPLEAFFVAKEMGLEEAAPLLLHVTQEQLQACIDLDCWTKDSLAFEELDAWLGAFLSDGPEALAHAFGLLDHELQVLLLAHLVEVYDIRSDEVPEYAEDVPRRSTPDGFFVVFARPVGNCEVEPFALLSALYNHDMQDAGRLVTAAKWELVSTLEEEAFRFREGRLQDLGFIAPDEAAALFAPPPAQPPDAAILQVPQAPQHLPALYASTLQTECLLAAAMGRVSDASLLDRLENEFLYLVNAAFVAYDENIGNIAHVARMAARVRDTVSLGMEHVLSPRGPLLFLNGEAVAADAAALLALWPLRALFAHGHKAVQPLQRAAVALCHDPIAANFIASNLAADDDPRYLDRAFLRHLAVSKPLMAGYDAHHPLATKAFGKKSELVAAQARLDTLRQEFA